jgi:hypothetical protein
MNVKKIYAYTIIGAIAMFNLFGCSSNVKYEKYSSKDPEINIAMDYISGWLYSEHRGSYNSYAQVLFYEKGDEKKIFKAGISVNVKDMSKLETRPATIEAVADDLKSKRMKFKDFILVSNGNLKVSGENAIVMDFSYNTLDKLYDVTAKLIPVKEKIAIFKKGNKFYTVRYENTAEDFKRFEKAFSRILNSITFK